MEFIICHAEISVVLAEEKKIPEVCFLCAYICVSDSSCVGFSGRYCNHSKLR